MKIEVIVFLAVLTFVNSENNGRYRPEVYGNNGRYRFPGDGHYSNPFGRYNNNFRNNARYPYKPYQELLTPYSPTSGKYSNDAQHVAVTYPSATVKPTTASPVYTLAPKSIVQPTALPLLQRSNIVDGNARIINQDSDLDINNYHFSYLTENGINAGEAGIVEPTENGGGTRVKGFYEYIGNDGLKYRVDYTADENGYRASGAHLP